VSPTYFKRNPVAFSGSVLFTTLYLSLCLQPTRSPLSLVLIPLMALTSHTTSFPSTPLVLTRVTAPGAPSYGRMSVIVFWWTVNSSVSVASCEPPPGPLPRPRESALRNVLNAALLRRPTGDDPVSAPRVPPEDLGAEVSSSEPTVCQPDGPPLKSTG
jgi:hypothetical protein